jgi:ribosomal protein L12E/L44/L45/RPP1/RPP2
LRPAQAKLERPYLKINKQTNKRVEGIVQVQHLPSKYEALSSMPSPAKKKERKEGGKQREKKRRKKEERKEGKEREEKKRKAMYATWPVLHIVIALI